MGRQGIRLPWSDVPATFRHEVEEFIGAQVVSANNIEGGFSPGPAARCELSDGRRVFVKAAGRNLNPWTPDMHRREGEVLASLPAEFPAPELLGVVDDGDWVALLIACADGDMPATPLDRPTADRVLRLAERLARAGRDVTFDSLTSLADTHGDIGGNWHKLADKPLDGLDTWSLRHLDALVDLEGDLAAASSGDHLVHADLRTDNMVFDAHDEHRDVVVDWPAACMGAPWIDLVGLLPSLHLDGGPPPHDVFDAHPLGRDADPGAVDVVIAAIAGYFTRGALLPPPPGLPTVRAFQAAQGAVTRAWLASRLG